MTIAVKVDGVKRALNELLVGLMKAQNDSIDDALKAAEAGAKSAVSSMTKTRTGALLRGFTTRRQNNFSGYLSNGVGHAIFIEKGTAPHTIRARNAQFLRFEIGGTVYFRRSVRHPGTKARPFTPLAMASGQMALRDGLRGRVDDLTARFNR